jgi:hypothetical protein
MKVLSYLQLMMQTEYIEDYLPEFILNECKDISVAAFYSQNFTPDLLIKYFKGWSKIDYYRDASLNQTGVQFTNFIFDIKFPYNQNCIWIEILEFEEAYFIPSNLDEFIIICKHVGIELEWLE